MNSRGPVLIRFHLFYFLFILFTSQKQVRDSIDITLVYTQRVANEEGLHMHHKFIKSIIPAVIIGSIVTSVAFSGILNGSGIGQVEAAAASSSSLSFTKFLENNAPNRTLKYINGVTTVTNLSSTVVLVNKQRNLPSIMCRKIWSCPVFHSASRDPVPKNK